MKICLITPPSAFLLDERVFPSLGILKVASALESQGFDVEHLDLSGIDNFVDVVVDHASRTDAEAFGLTATSPQMPAALRIRNALKSVRPKAKIVLGGPHVTLVNAAVKDGASRATGMLNELSGMFDTLVCGDGEDAAAVAFQEDIRVVDADSQASPLFMTNKRLNETPFPARHLIDLDSYHYKIDGVRATSVIAQLGCPFECAFCGGRASPMLRKIRTRSKESILAEIEDIGYRGFMFYDDELNVNKEMVPLMRALRPLGLNLRGFVKAELFTDEQAEAMAQAGFRWVLVGFESGSPEILKNIRKKATREDNTRCLRIAKKHGLKVKALMSIGHAGESHATIHDTQAWLMQEKPDDFDCTIITTYPGTPYFDRAKASGDHWTYTDSKTGARLHMYDVNFTNTAEYYKGMPGEYNVSVWTDSIGPEALAEARDRLENSVRADLRIPFNVGQPGMRYEASMGQVPGHILRDRASRTA